jgi:hypothetical protein
LAPDQHHPQQPEDGDHLRGEPAADRPSHQAACQTGGSNIYICSKQGDTMCFKEYCSPTHFSTSIHNLYSGKMYPENLGQFFIFQKTAQNKQSPIGRKFVHEH